MQNSNNWKLIIDEPSIDVDKITLIINCVCKEYSITTDMLRCPTRKQDICDARHIIAALISAIYDRKICQEKIIKFVPLHDRTMVSYSRQKISCLMRFNKYFRARMIKIFDSLGIDDEERALLTQKIIDFQYRTKKTNQNL